MKRIIFAFIFISLSISILAQSDSLQIVPLTPSTIVRLSFIAPKLVIEFAPTEFFTLTTGFWLYASIWTTNEYKQQIYNPTISPSFTFQPKFYFNLADRQAKGKRTDFYSGWFVGMPFAIRFSDLRYSLGATIGFQCTFGKRWFWNFDAGPGFSYYDSRFHFAGVGTVGFGVILNKI